MGTVSARVNAPPSPAGRIATKHPDAQPPNVTGTPAAIRPSASRTSISRGSGRTVSIVSVCPAPETTRMPGSPSSGADDSLQAPATERRIPNEIRERRICDSAWGHAGGTKNIGGARVANKQSTCDLSAGHQKVREEAHQVAGHRVPPNDLRISCEGAARQPPRRPRLEPTAWRLPEPARPRQLHALVRPLPNARHPDSDLPSRTPVHPSN